MENFELILDNSRLMSPINRLFFLCNKMSDYSTFYANKHKELLGELDLLEEKYGESFDTDSIYAKIFSNIGEQQEFLDFFDEIIGATIEVIYSIYSIDESSILFNKEEIIFKNLDLLYVSPFLFPFRLWKKVVIHDLLFSKGNLSEKKEKVMAVLKDLKFRINNDKVWDVWESFKGEETMIIYGCAESFKVKINDYIDFVSEINSQNTVNINNLLNDIKEHRKKIKNRGVGVVKLNENCSKSILVKGLYELFHSMKIDLPDYFNKSNIEDFVNHLLNGELDNFTNGNFQFLKGKKNKSNRIDLIKYLVFLSHSNFILNNQTEVVKILSKYLNKPNDIGFGERTLKGEIRRDNYYLFSDELERGKTNMRQNLISTVLLSSDRVREKYEDSTAYNDLKLHLSKKNKTSNPLVS